MLITDKFTPFFNLCVIVEGVVTEGNRTDYVANNLNKITIALIVGVFAFIIMNCRYLFLCAIFAKKTFPLMEGGKT